MATATISIDVDEATAQAFAAATPEQQRKVRLLLQLRLRELTSKPERTLQEIMDDLSREAHARGLTPTILESLLHDE